MIIRILQHQFVMINAIISSGKKTDIHDTDAR